MKKTKAFGYTRGLALLQFCEEQRMVADEAQILEGDFRENGSSADKPKSGSAPGEVNLRTRRKSEFLKVLSFEDLLKLGGAAGVFLYVLGLFTVNDYLFQIGVTDFSLVRVQFAITGLMVLSVVGVFLIGISFVAVLTIGLVASVLAVVAKSRFPRIENFFPEAATSRDPALAIWGNMFGLGMFGFLIWILYGPVTNRFDLKVTLAFDSSNNWSIVLRIASTSIVAFVITHAFSARAKAMGRIAFSVSLLVVIVSAGLAGATIVDVIATSVYPELPSQLGGGKPRTVQLAVSDSDAKRINHIVPGYFDSTGNSFPLDMLWETEGYFVVRMDHDENARIIQIDKNLVLFVVGEPRYLGPTSKPTPTPNSVPTAVPNPSLAPASPSPGT